MLLSSFLECAVAATPPPVPAQFQDAYNTLNTNISSFQATVDAAWDQTPSPMLNSAQLQTADSDLTTTLIKPNYYEITVLSELNSLQALGCNAITFHINFPSMYIPFYTNAADYQAYLAFYTQLVNEIRSRGLKIIIESTIANVYPGNNSDQFIPYYQTLDWPTYAAQRAQTVANIAQLFHPDYLIVVAEPDTEANSTGQPNAATVSGSTQMLQGMITAIRATGVTGVKVGAGCGTWDPLFLQFIQSFTTLPLQTIDMHIYPVNQNNLPDAFTAVAMIQASGKQPSMSEMWSYKETDAEYALHLPYTTIYARDVFSFWSPIDVSFMHAITSFANYGHFAFLTPFWTHYFGAYLDYNLYIGVPDATLITTSASASTAANITGQYTETAHAYEALLIPAPDRTPPAVPVAPTLIAYSQTAANLMWTPTTDNVGVSAYNVYRDGTKIATLSNPLQYFDLTLQPHTTYKFSLTAFDASGNESAQSAPTIVTTYSYPDLTPPSVPTGLQQIAPSDINIQLIWTPSVDNVAVLGYEIYRGLTAANINPYSSTTATSFLDLGVSPGNVYYYQVDAYDTSGNHSARSAVFQGTTLPDVTPPTTPTNVAVSALAGPLVTVSWAASVDDYAVGIYEIYRGTTSSNLQLLGWTVAPVQTWVDTYAISGRTYYYSVAAADIARNLSPLSPPIVVTVP